MANPIQETETICKIDHDNQEIMVFEKAIIDLFSFVGDGIYDFQTESQIKPFWYGIPYSKEWHNEVKLRFDEEAWAGIFLSKWVLAEEILEKIKIQNIGLEEYVINPSQNWIQLEFDVKYQMGIY